MTLSIYTHTAKDSYDAQNTNNQKTQKRESADAGLKRSDLKI